MSHKEEQAQTEPSPSFMSILREQLRESSRSLATWEKKYDSNSADNDFVKERIKFYSEQVQFFQKQLIESK